MVDAGHFGHSGGRYGRSELPVPGAAIDGHDDAEVDATVERVKHAMPTVDVVGIRYDLNLNGGDDTKQIGPKTAGLWISDSVCIYWTRDTTEAVAGAASWIGLLIAL